MPTELEELVEFLHHGNTQIRQTAVEQLVHFSETDPAIFKTNQLTPVKDLKLLIKDYPQIAKNALTILVNISNDRDVLHNISNDDTFLESLLLRITNAKEPNANEMAMLFANMGKLDELSRIITLKRDIPLGLSTSKIAIDQMMDCFVKGAAGSYNSKADFDYLVYLFADLAKFPSGQTYFTTPQPYDSIHPLSKLVPFTNHASSIRRRGVASTLKNVSFSLSTHPELLSPNGINILPYILLPLSGPETFSDSENDQLLEELQYLPPDKERDPDTEILKTHLETLLLLTSTREGRDVLRDRGVYLVVREAHLHVEDEGVREGCERLVQVLMRDEEGDEKGGHEGGMHALNHHGEADEPAKHGRPAKPFGRNGATADAPGMMVTTRDDDNEEDEDDKVVEIF